MKNAVNNFDLANTDILDAWALLHHLYRYCPRALDQVLDSADYSESAFEELIAKIPAHWDDDWAGWTHFPMPSAFESHAPRRGRAQRRPG